MKKLYPALLLVVLLFGIYDSLFTFFDALQSSMKKLHLTLLLVVLLFGIYDSLETKVLSEN